jgi:hypothetical protein
MEEMNVTTWEEFLGGLEEIQKERAGSSDYVQNCPLLFRGQGNSCWRLSATLERACERMLYKDYYRIISKIRPQIESLVGGDWPIPPYPEVERLVATYEEFDNTLWAGDRPAYAYMAYHERHKVGDARPLPFPLKLASRLMSDVHLSVWWANRRSRRPLHINSSQR